MRVSHIIRVRYLNLISNRIICRIAYLTRLLKYEIRIFNHTNIFYRTPVSQMTWITSDVSVSPGNKAFLDDVGPISIRRLSCWLDIGPTYTREVVFAGSQLHGMSLVYARMNTEVYGRLAR